MLALCCGWLQFSTQAADLLSWHTRVHGVADGPALNAVTFGKGLFVAVGENGTVATSTDGSNWAAQVSGTTNGFWRVVYGNGTFLAGGGRQLRVSPDGTNWVAVPWPNYDAVLFGLAFANDRFILITRWTQDQNLWTSTDATNWALTGYFSMYGLVLDAAYGAGRYVVVGIMNDDFPVRAEAPFVATSTDLKKFYLPDLDLRFLATGAELQSVVFDGAKFIAGGGGYIGSSDDGVNWRMVASGFPGVHSIAYGDGVYVAGAAGAILVSTDGYRWTTTAQQQEAVAGVAYGNNTFVGVCARGTILQSDPVVTLSFAGGTNSTLSIRGPVGRSVVIQAVDRLSSTNNWKTIGSIVLTNSPVTWIPPSNQSQGFYRASLQD